MTKPTLDDMWLLATRDLQYAEVMQDVYANGPQQLSVPSLKNEIEVRRAICDLINWVASRKAKKEENAT